MCSRSCARCLGYTLIPLALCCIVANILLFFPNGELTYSEYLSKYVWYFEGIVGGGILMFLPAAVFISMGDCCGCCGYERCGESCAMLGSILAALIGLAGSAYCFIVSVLGLMQGPLCKNAQSWDYHLNNGGEYLLDPSTWNDKCLEPHNVVLWNVVLFSMLLGLSAIEAFICALQVINGLVGAICGPCCSSQEYAMNKA
ncbi:transmembrane 4 L6 family member 1 [Amia ocellicauda]|uniref:transmembrane 4 L6 family member 1 n=1 Tax=Amia ocellicauda TaxID=2972642 RepID=UPI00346446A9|nr:T4S1 protein [Amia calva]